MYEVFRQLVEGRQVALLGPAKYLTQACQGNHIDGHDLVCRINWCWPVPPDYHRYIGSRTDILGHCCHPWLNVRPLSLGGLKYLIFLDVQENQHLNFDRNINQYLLTDKAAAAGLPFHTYGRHCPVYQAAEKFYNPARPMGVGCYLVALLLSCGVKEVYVTGFDVTGGYLGYYPMDESAKPDDLYYQATIDWFRGQNDVRLKLDWHMLGQSRSRQVRFL